MTDWIIIGIVVLLTGSALAYIIREKKKGTVCIGCPDAPNCPHRNQGCPGHNKSHSGTNNKV